MAKTPSNKSGVTKIFVSHITEEKKLALTIKAMIEKTFGDAVQAFVSSDEEAQLAGEDFLEIIRKEITAASAVIVLCSEASLVRPWIRFELGAAWISGKILIPLCHSDISPNELPNPLHKLHGVELNPGGLRTLYGTLAKLVAGPSGKLPKKSDASVFEAFLPALTAEEAEVPFKVTAVDFERYINVTISEADLKAGTISPETKVKTTADTRHLFKLKKNDANWRQIEAAALQVPDQRWLMQLKNCITAVSRNQSFRPIQAVYHSQAGSFQPVLSRVGPAVHGDAARFHIQMIETVVAPLKDVDNDFGLLATLLRLGLRFRYEVIVRFGTDIQLLKNKTTRKPDAESQALLRNLLEAIQVIENDARSRGSENIDPASVEALFHDDAERKQMRSVQKKWNKVRVEMFAEAGPLDLDALESMLSRMAKINYVFMKLSARLFQQKIQAEWRSSI